MPAILISLLAAAAFALASYLKHRSAEAVTVGPSKTLGRDGVAPVATLIRATVRDPIWFGGLAADTAGLALQVVALRLAALSVVQPVLVATVIFSLLLRHFLYRRVPLVDLGWAALASIALVGFLIIVGPFTPNSRAAPDRLPAVIAVAIGLVVATGCVTLARAGASRGRSAAFLGIAVGLIYAGNAALLKTLTSIVGHGAIALVSSWQPYLLIGTGVGGLILNQLAFQAGPLTASLPAISMVDPLASIAIGVAVYDEPIRSGGIALFGFAATLSVLGLAVVQLARSSA